MGPIYLLTTRSPATGGASVVPENTKTALFQATAEGTGAVTANVRFEAALIDGFSILGIICLRGEGLASDAFKCPIGARMKVRAVVDDLSDGARVSAAVAYTEG